MICENKERWQFRVRPQKVSTEKIIAVNRILMRVTEGDWMNGRLSVCFDKMLLDVMSDGVRRMTVLL